MTDNYILNLGTTMQACLIKLNKLLDQMHTVDDFLQGATALLGQDLSAEGGMLFLQNGREFELDFEMYFGDLILAQEIDVCEYVRQASLFDLPHAIELQSEGKFGVGVSILVNEELQGALVLAFEDKHLANEALLKLPIIKEFFESNIKHIDLEERLRIKNQELQTIYKIDQLRDASDSLDDLLVSVLAEVNGILDSDGGLVFLFDEHGHNLELKASVSAHCNLTAQSIEELVLLSKQTLENGEIEQHSWVTEQVGSLLQVPLILDDRILGVLGVYKSSSEPFYNRHIALLQAIASQMDTAIFESLDKYKLRNTFQKYVSEDVIQEMLNRNSQNFMATHRQVATVLFSDIRGFTTLAEGLDAEMVARMLNKHLDAMTDIVFQFQGTLDKFVGDQVVAIFGAPIFYDNHAEQAVRAAIKMQHVQKSLIDGFAQQGFTMGAIGIGINTGEMVLGNIGGKRRVDYTAIGDHMNLGSRLCDIAKPNQILISEYTQSLLGKGFETLSLGDVYVKNREAPSQTYEVIYESTRHDFGG